MKKSISVPATKQAQVAAIGLDLSDRRSAFIAIDDKGTVISEGKVTTRGPQLQEWAGAFPATVVAIEAGPHSTWVSRLLTSCGHEVIVANPGKVPSISRSRSKSDWRDAEQLARLARFDRTMLHEIQHRTVQTQKDLQCIRSRDVLVGARTKLVSHVRGTLKAHGQFVQRCSTTTIVRRVRTTVDIELQELLNPVLETIEMLSEKIKRYEHRVEQLVRSRYADAEWLMQIPGVGALTALSFMLVLEDHRRFRQSRMVGPYLGLTPARDQSGESDPQKGISKEGDRLLRKLLVQSAHYILGPFGPDSDLRRHGLRIAARGGKNAKKRAAVAVARKLSVVMHRLWAMRQAYVPLFNNAVTSAA